MSHFQTSSILLRSLVPFFISMVLAGGFLLEKHHPESSVEYHNSIEPPLADTSQAEIVLLGSSRFVYGIDAELLTAELGAPVVNASRTAMRLEELGEILDYFLEKSRSARVFVLELLSPIPEPYIQTSRRQTAWHSIDATKMLIGATWAEENISPFTKLKFTHRHLQLAALRYGIYGAYTPEFVEAPSTENTRNSGDSWRQEHEEVLESVVAGEYRRQYRRSQSVYDFYRRLTRRIRESGIEPIFVAMPQAKDNDLDGLDILLDYVDGCRVIDLSSPQANPEFYKVELWTDPFHLGEDGARILTEKLAKKLSRNVQ